MAASVAQGCRAFEQERLERLGLPPDVVHTIQGVRAPSTTGSDSAKWSTFHHWYGEEHCPYVVPPGSSAAFPPVISG